MVVLTLALGIGANTALFSVVDAVLLRPLPYQQPGQLVAVKVDMPGLNLVDTGMSQPELDDFQRTSGVFANISAVWPISANITGREKPERVEANAVSINYFALLGAKPALGRVFNDGDSREGFSERCGYQRQLMAQDVRGRSKGLGDKLPPRYRSLHNCRGHAT